MRFLTYLLCLLISIPTNATLNNVDKTQIFNKNLLVNGGFENGKQKWTASAGTFTVSSSTPLVGKYKGVWDAAASADTLTTTAVAIPAGFYGRNGAASCVFVTASGTATHTIQAYDGTNILSSVTITSSTSPTRTSANFIFPSSGNISLRIYANANEPSIDIDDCYLGPSEGYNTADISQATFVGSVLFANNCSWTATQTSYADYSADASCTTTATGSGVSAAGSTLPGITVTNLPPGEYFIIATGQFYKANTASVQCLFRFYDGTTEWGNGSVYGGAVQAVAPSFYGRITYTNAQSSATIKIQSLSDGGSAACAIGASANFDNLRISLYRYPTNSEKGFRPDIAPASWSGYHEGSCSWARTSTSYGDPTADATCTFTAQQNTNFGSVTSYLSGSDKLPGIVFTPKRAGRYFVCSQFRVTHATSGANIGIGLYDDATQIASTEMNVSAATVLYGPNICGIVVATNTAAKTVSLETKASSGSVTIGNASNYMLQSVYWQIFALDQALPAPYLVNSVTSNASDVTQINAANINCDAGSAITSQRGSWVSSVGNISGGACAITLSGTYSSTPYCWAIPNAAFASVGLILSVAASSSTAISVDCEDDASTACTSVDFNLFCVGSP